MIPSGSSKFTVASTVSPVGRSVEFGSRYTSATSPKIPLILTESGTDRMRIRDLHLMDFLVQMMFGIT